MPSTKLPPEHHIVRNVPWGKLRKDDADPERVIGVLGEAFKMRPLDETLSTTWLEYFFGTRQEQIYGAIRAIRASKLEIKSKSKSGFAIGNVGQIVAITAERNYSIRVLHEPEDDNKAHVAVRRWPRDDMALFELLAAEAWSEFVLNKDIPKGAQAAPDKSAWTPPDRE